MRTYIFTNIENNKRRKKIEDKKMYLNIYHNKNFTIDFIIDQLIQYFIQ